MTDKVREHIKSSVRYKHFTILDNPTSLNELCEGKEKVYVALHDIRPIPDTDYIIGFCGVIEYRNGEIYPLDGDSYSKDMKIWGYEWFDCDEYDNAVDILVESW